MKNHFTSKNNYEKNIKCKLVKNILNNFFSLSISCIKIENERLVDMLRLCDTFDGIIYEFDIGHSDIMRRKIFDFIHCSALDFLTLTAEFVTEL